MRTTTVPNLAAAIAIALAACTADNPDYLRGDGGLGDPGQPAPTFAPSHVGTNWWTLGSADLSLNGHVDTTDFTINGSHPPDGVTFMRQNQYAVLAVHSLLVAQQAQVSVTGDLPLLVVAESTITIDGLLDAGAHQATPGPGGAPHDRGQSDGSGFDLGHGNKGSGSPLDSGGSGAGYGDRGGYAGAVAGKGCGGPPTPPTPRNGGGTPFGDATLSTLFGGAGGGTGSIAGRGCPSGMDCNGGAGGGGLQLSAGTSLSIAGLVNAGGGGGNGGCQNPRQVDSGSGGGGGSGGSILLEAPSVTVIGFVAANGGGGGGGAFDTPGGAGQDGQPSATAARAGSGGLDNSGREATDQRGGQGGTAGAGGDSKDVTGCGNSGGGGGSAGRIYVRAHGAGPDAKRFSPAPAVGTL